MPANINDIINEMDAAQSAEPTLATLNSPSNTAIYTVFKRVIAAGILELSRLWDIAKAQLNQIAQSQIYGTPAWYVNLVLNVMPSSPATKASCLENGTKVLLKVAKLSSGSTAQLTTSELADVRAYVSGKKIAGTDIDVISQVADKINISMTIQYVGTQSVVKAAVEQAIKDYLSGLAFGAILSKGLLGDYILGVPGVIDCYVDVLSIDYGAGYQVVPGNVAQPDAGYYEVGKDISNNDLITLNMYS